MQAESGHGSSNTSVKSLERRAFLLRSTSLLSIAAVGMIGATPAARAAPMQNDWAHCIYCNQLFFNGYRGNKGRCAAYGVPSRQPHVAERRGDKKYQLTYDDSTGPGQGDWRYCRKCGVLFFNGYPEKGVCAADRRGHEAAGYNFFLYHDRQRHADEEDGWRYCDKCHALYYAAAAKNVGCPADGKGHHAAGYRFVVGQKAYTL